MALRPPYLPRNGPFLTTRELLRVRGVSRELLLGEDHNQNGLLDPGEDDGTESDPPDNRDGVLNAGWSSLFTVNSISREVNAAGEERVNVQSASESALAAVPGLNADLAKAIVAYRGQHQLQSLADLLDVTPVSPQSTSQANPGPPQPGRPPSPPPVPTSTAQASGPKLISEELLMDIADDLTAGSGGGERAAVNINTAVPDVLMCLPGMTPELANAIVTYRKSAGFFPNIAHLLKVPGMNQSIFKQAAPKLTARSETFRILCEGRIASTGVRKRIEIICRLGSADIETLSYREDL
jgi:competence ComEA-like helix-hairpin-helix protein